MAKPEKPSRKELLSKKALLDAAEKQLKKEFIGIDNVITQVVGAASSWYLFPFLQERPVVINLWGMTGVGKTSFVTRLTDLLEMKEKFYYFTLGSSSMESDYTPDSIKNILEKIHEHDNGCPVMLALDEFQHSRTINEEGKETNKSTAVLWQLLDSGKFQINIYGNIEQIYDLMMQLRFLLLNGVRVIKGRVVAKKEYFAEVMDLYRWHDYRDAKLDLNDIRFVQENFFYKIYEFAGERLGFSCVFDVQWKLDELDGYQTIDFLRTVVECSSSPRMVDCSKTLIFVMGNLDEAYTMCSDYNPDMDADEFHEESLNINVPDIKKALRKRFRNEQIARLGNTHIIYPAFSSEMFRKIIRLELDKIAEKVYHD